MSGMGPNPTLIKAFEADATINKYAIVMFDTTDTLVIPATAVTDQPIGVAQHDAVDGERVDVAMAGIVEVKASGAITRGDYVVAGAAGVAKAGTGATAKQNAIGKALATAADGDIIPILIAPSQFDLA